MVHHSLLGKVPRIFNHVCFWAYITFILCYQCLCSDCSLGFVLFLPHFQEALSLWTDQYWSNLLPSLHSLRLRPSCFAPLLHPNRSNRRSVALCTSGFDCFRSDHDPDQNTEEFLQLNHDQKEEGNQEKEKTNKTKEGN